MSDKVDNANDLKRLQALSPGWLGASAMDPSGLAEPLFQPVALVTIPTEPVTPATGLPDWAAEFQELELGPLADRLIARLPTALGYAAGAIYSHDSRGDTYRLIGDSSAELSLPLVISGDEIPQHAVVAAARSGRRGPFAAARGHGDVELIALASDGVVSGVLCVWQARSGGLPAGRQAVVLQMAARALRNALLFGQARAEARLDCKTGLFNDRWATETLEAEIQRAARYHASLAVLMIDVDGLKPINDQLGHLAGDRLLRFVADRIRSVLRSADAAARLGGDEFLVLLPETDAAGAEQVAGRVQAALAQDALELAGRRIDVRASLGVATWRSGLSAAQLIAAADQAMYAEKRSRRATPAV
jgi:diguanylate cyclase (GGDEF)-like protein